MKFLLAILEVSDLNRSLVFYRDLLGDPDGYRVQLQEKIQ